MLASTSKRTPPDVFKFMFVNNTPPERRSLSCKQTALHHALTYLKENPPAPSHSIQALDYNEVLKDMEAALKCT